MVKHPVKADPTMNKRNDFTATLICQSAKALAFGAAQRQLNCQPNAERDYGVDGRALILDTEVRFRYLAEAVAFDRPELLSEQLRWLKVLCAARGVDLNLIRTNLQCMAEELRERLLPECATLTSACIETSLGDFDRAPVDLPSLLEGAHPHLNLTRKFLLAVLETREQDATQLVLEALESGVSIDELYEDVIYRVQAEIGRMWQMTEITIAEEHYCTDIVNTCATLLRSRVPRPEPNGHRIITAAVSNETHDIGIRIVTQAFERKGWHALQLGANTPTISLIDAARDFGCDLIALSANIVLYVRQTADVIRSIRSAPETAKVPILVGGQPFNLVDDLWRLVGADGYAKSGVSSPQVAEELLNSKNGEIKTAP